MATVKRLRGPGVRECVCKLRAKCVQSVCKVFAEGSFCVQLALEACFRDPSAPRQCSLSALCRGSTFRRASCVHPVPWVSKFGGTWCFWSKLRRRNIDSLLIFSTHKQRTCLASSSYTCSFSSSHNVLDCYIQTPYSSSYFPSKRSLSPSWMTWLSSSMGT